MSSDTRITARSRPRFDFPSAEIPTNVEADDKTQWVGPLTRTQLVEFIWRVKKIRWTGSVSCTFTREEDEAAPEARIGGSESYTVDVTLTRTSAFGELPIFSYEDSTELSVLNDNLGSAGWDFRDTVDGFLDSFSSTWINVDDSGQYWLRPFFRFGMSPSTSDVPAATLAFGEETTTNIGDSDTDYDFVTLALTIGGSDVNFPVVFHVREFGSGWVAIDDVVITAASGTVEITEWFPYATNAGVAAWGTATGLPVNGGPGA